MEDENGTIDSKGAQGKLNNTFLKKGLSRTLGKYSCIPLSRTPLSRTFWENRQNAENFCSKMDEKLAHF